MTRKRKLRLGVLLLTLGLCSGGVLWMYGGCATPPLDGHLRNTEARSQKLMSLAAAEAAKIEDVDRRLTRQLNLADMQISRGWKDDARRTLAASRATLSSPDAAKLNDHARLSGWVSVSELCRAVDDKAGAATACDGAVAELEKLPSEAARCEYVMGVSNELQYIRGKEAAAKMLEKAGPWTRAIDHLEKSRAAVIAFATALFNLDEYERGQAMLGHVADAGWRSEKLQALAMQPVDSRISAYAARKSSAESTVAVDAAGEPQMVPGSTGYYGKNLQYRNVYQNQLRANTGSDTGSK
jgi:hypothetical protein